MALLKASQLNATASSTVAAISSSKVLASEIKIKNLSSQAVFIGNSYVTTSNGYQLKQDEEIGFGEVDGKELDLNDIFAVTDSSTADIRVIFIKRK